MFISELIKVEYVETIKKEIKKINELFEPEKNQDYDNYKEDEELVFFEIETK